MAGHFDGQRLSLEEVWRFQNQGSQFADGWHWDADRLFANIKKGLSVAASRFGDSIVSVAVDTWGVDYGLLNKEGHLVNAPWMYRDERTDGLMAEAARLAGAENLWQRTGIQPLFFNTIYQLMAEAHKTPAALKQATDLLFMPDLLNYWMCGVKAIERTIASTAGLLRAGSAHWDLELAGMIGIPERLLKPVTEPATRLGPLLGDLAKETGLHNVSVTTCGSHDTASAVLGVPAQSPSPLFLSSGTWSLLGRELPGPVLETQALKARFSNEQGLEGTTRFLTNIAGMWLVQECRRVWAEKISSFDALFAEARTSEVETWIDPDAEEFQRSCDMPSKIGEWIARSGQKQPAGMGAMVRVILESLAIKYRRTVAKMRTLQPDLPDTLHIVGGGSQNALLNQMTADATGLRVVAGPIEATAAGNILAQMIACGAIGSVAEGREILRHSFEHKVFMPCHQSVWDDKEDLFQKIETRMKEQSA